MDNTITIKDPVKFFEVNLRIKKFIFYRWTVLNIEKKYPLGEVREIIKKELERCINHCQKAKDEIFNEYMDMSTSNKPYKDREEWLEGKVDRLTMIGQYQANLVETLGDEDSMYTPYLEIVPYKNWLVPGDEKKIERLGFEKFIRCYGFILKKAYVSKNAKEIERYKFIEK